MIPRQLLQAIREKTCVLYAGAGFSLEATLPGGSTLPTAKGLGYRLALELHREGYLPDEPKEAQPFDFAILAEDYQTAFGRQKLVLLLHEIFGREGLRPGEAHRLAIKIFPIIITTNYDPLFEYAAITQGRQPIVIRRDEPISFSSAGNRPTIIKLHGDLDDPKRIVITNEDYRRKPIPDGLREKLCTTLSEKTVLFIGSGLADSDFQEIYFQVLDRLGNLKPRAFVVTPFPAEHSPYRKPWELFRKRWERREMQFLPGTAGAFLNLVYERLRKETEKTTDVTTGADGDITRNNQELMKAYRAPVVHQVATVRIFGEEQPRPLEKIFVELNIIEEYQRPSAHAEWMGLMDAELRRRRDIFAPEAEDTEARGPERRRGQVKRTVKPDELLRGRTHAVIVGAPGCGKTTLLKYLAWKTLQEDNRFPVLLELKSITEEAFAKAQGNLADVLFDKAVAGLLDLHPAERERFKELFLARLNAGDAAIFLDGLDEVSGAGFFNDLCRSVNEFTRSVSRDNAMIISTRPYALQTRFEGLKEMEIAPLSPRQIQEVLHHYYGDDPTVRQLVQYLRRRRDLRELTRVPFLLGVIAQLYRQQGEIIGERLELYRQIVQQLVIHLDRDKLVERFHVLDPEGSLKRDFLKQLAYERLFVDAVAKDAERLVFTGDVIVQKAQRFCRPDIDPHLFAADVKATPLLREIGADIYAFAHLTLQEYLAAVALAEREDCARLFCRTYFNPTLAEMEVLPMTLGLVRRPDDLYAALEQLPESLTFTNFRLRARGLAYTGKIRQEHLTKLADRLIEFISERNLEETPYVGAVLQSFSVATGQSLEFIMDRLLSLLHHDDGDVRGGAALARGWIGGERAVETLLAPLKDQDPKVRFHAVEALVPLGDARALDGLLAALQDEDPLVRSGVAEALGALGDTRAVDGLLAALWDADSHVRWQAARALEGLLAALADEDISVRWGAAGALGAIGDGRAVEGLLAALKDMNGLVRWGAAGALGNIGDEALAHGLLRALSHEDNFVRQKAARVVGYYSTGTQVLEALLRLSTADPVDEVRNAASEARKRFYRKLWYMGEEIPALATVEEIGREKALEETRAFIAHEVKSAIGPLRGFAELLKETLTQPDLNRDALANYTQRILRQTDVAYEVVNRYVDYTKPLTPTLRPTDINRLLVESLDEVRAECARKNLEISQHLGQIGEALIDRELIKQVLRNILLNAIEAMEHGGNLTSATRQDGDRIIVTISDTGPGIKPEHVSRVFELGFTTKLGRHGAGVGLPLARRFVEEAHNGRRSIANTPGGVGATVTIELLLAKQETAGGT